VDAVILVFSLEDEQSFQCVLDYYRALKQEKQLFTASSSSQTDNTSMDISSSSALDIPVMLVGTQGMIVFDTFLFS
jgi:hypothetical protein